MKQNLNNKILYNGNPYNRQKELLKMKYPKKLILKNGNCRFSIDK